MIEESLLDSIINSDKLTASQARVRSQNSGLFTILNSIRCACDLGYYEVNIPSSYFDYKIYEELTKLGYSIMNNGQNTKIRW